MAGASGNSEGQLGSVEEQLRGVEVRIQIVEKEISRLEERIVLVEEQVQKCSDNQEREHLLAKEAQLRDEKAQLRDEKAQLRDEKSQLLQGRDLGTEHDWLVQEVVVPAVPSGSRSYPSCYSTKKRMHNPVKVEHWDVKREIEEFLERADKRKRAYGISVTSSTRKTSETAKLEGVIVTNIMSEMQDFMKKKQPQLNFGFIPQVPLSSIEKKKDETDEADELDETDEADELDETDEADELDETGLNEGAKSSSELIEFFIMNPRADFVITIREKNAVVVEVKNGGLGPDQGVPWHLHKAWTECSCSPGEADPNCRCVVLGITAAHGERLIRCISQLYDYMAVFEVGYGILTDSRDWYLFKRDNAGCLKISVGFKAMSGHPPVLAALSYLVDIASNDNTKFGKGPRNGKTPKLHGAAPSKPSSESSDDVKSDPDFRGRENSISVPERPKSTRNRPDGNQLALKDVSAVDLNLKMTGGIISCEGWSGCVAIGRLYGQAVAVKFAYINTERAEALLKEVVAYQKMEKLWGVFVPRLTGYGTTCNGRAVFVATELIDGVELGEVAVTQEVKSAALEALDAVHACGLLHGDIEARNIMVVWGKQPPVRILDFGFSCVTRSKKLQKAERVRLEYLLAYM